MGADQFSSQDGVELNINGGTITIDAEGDGLDSNGNFTMAGGTVADLLMVATVHLTTTALQL